MASMFKCGVNTHEGDVICALDWGLRSLVTAFSTGDDPRVDTQFSDWLHHSYRAHNSTGFGVVSVGERFVTRFLTTLLEEDRRIQSMLDTDGWHYPPERISRLKARRVALRAEIASERDKCHQQILDLCVLLLSAHVPCC